MSLHLHYLPDLFLEADRPQDGGSFLIRVSDISLVSTALIKTSAPQEPDTYETLHHQSALTLTSIKTGPVVVSHTVAEILACLMGAL